MTINKRSRNAVTQCKTYPGANYGSGCDHVLVVGELKVRLKKGVRPQQKARRHWNVLKGEEVRSIFEIEVRNRYEALQEEADTEEVEEVVQEWGHL